MSDKAIASKIHGLVVQLEDYLAGRLSHAAIQHCIERHFRDWDSDVAWHAAPYFPGEHTYWCALWTAQHLADEAHWRDGLPQRDLSVLIELLRHRQELPTGWQGLRPNEIHAA